MDIAQAFANAGITAPAIPDGPLPENLCQLAFDILACAAKRGIRRDDTDAHLRVALAAERHHNVATALRTRMTAEADRVGAAQKLGTTMAHEISEIRRISLQKAISQVIQARKQMAYPNAVQAMAESKISVENLGIATSTLDQLTAYYDEADFGAAEQAVLEHAQMHLSTTFRQHCDMTLEQLDQTIARKNSAARIKRRRQSYRDRGVAFTLLGGGDFGAIITARVPAEYWNTLRPIIEARAESLARAQRRKNSKGHAAPRRIRLLDAIYQLVTGHNPPPFDAAAKPVEGSERPEILSLSIAEATRDQWDTTRADCGRTERQAPPALRALLIKRDGGCVFPNCTVPPPGCAGHHIQSWQDGGGTDMGNMALVCNYHHSLVNHPPGDPDNWTVEIDSRGIPGVRPPRNQYGNQPLQYHPRFKSGVIPLPPPSATTSHKLPELQVLSA